MAVISKIAATDGAVYELKDRTSYGRTYYPEMEAGGINVSTGANYATGNLNRFRSVGRTAYQPGATLTIAEGYSVRLVYFDTNGDYSGESNAWDTFTKVVPECGYFRILARNSSITDFTGMENTVISVTDQASIQERFDQIFEAIDSLNGLPSAEGMSF